MAQWELGGVPFRPAGQQDHNRVLYPFVYEAGGAEIEAGGFGWVWLPETYDVKFYENTEREVGVLCPAGQKRFPYPVFFQEFVCDDGEELTTVRYPASARELDDELQHQWCIRLNARGDDVSTNIPISWIKCGISVTAFGTPLHKEGRLLTSQHACDHMTCRCCDTRA